MSDDENKPFLATPEQSGGSEGLSVHGALLERYLRLLQADPALRAAMEQPGQEHMLQWAADELRHTAATLVGLSADDAEYELKGVLREVMERLGVAADAQLAQDRTENP